MKKWQWVLLAIVLMGSLGVMFWVTGIGDEPEPLFEHVESLEEIPERDPRKLTVWAYGGDEAREHWDENIATFRETIGEEVTLVLFADAATYGRILSEARDKGKLPDLFLVNAAQANRLARQERLAPLVLPAAVASEWASPTVRALAYPGRPDAVSAYPSDFSMLALYYNRRMFDGMGMAPPGDHWSWPILTGIAKSHYKKGADGETERYGVELPLSLEFWNALSVEYGAPVYADGEWQAGGLKPGAPQAKALAFLLDFYFTYVVVAPPSLGENGQYFLRGQSAMAVAGAELLPRLREAGFDWGVTVLPKENRHASPLRVEGWAVRADSAKAREAAELALLLASGSQRPGWLPARLSENIDDERIRVFYDQLKDAVLPPRLELPANADEITFKVFRQAIDAGDINPVAVVQNLESRLFSGKVGTGNAPQDAAGSGNRSKSEK